MASNNRKKHVKLCVSILLTLFIFCTRAISQSIPGYLPAWFHNNFSTLGGESEGNAIAYYGDDIYVTGYFYGEHNFFCNSSFPAQPCSLNVCPDNDVGFTSTYYIHYYRDAFLAKYCKSDGGLRWIKVISGCACSDAGDVSGTDITIDGSGNPIVVGYFESAALEIDGGTPLTGISNAGATGTRDVFVMQFDPSGNNTGGISIGSSSREDVYGVVRNNNGIYICGSFEGDLSTVIGSTGSAPLVHTGGKDVFVIRIPTNFSSSPCGISMAGSGDEEAYDIAVDNSGNLFVTGYFESNDGDFLNLNHGGMDMFLTQINYSTSASPCSLAVGVTTVLGGLNDDYGHALAVDGFGGIYVTGGGLGPLTLNNSPTVLTSPFGDVDIFISRYTVNTLAHNWTHFIGGSSTDVPASVCIDGGGGIIVTGHIPGISPLYTTSSSPVPLPFLGNPTNPNVNVCPGNQANNQTNSFIINYSSTGNATTNSIFSSTYGHFINSITVNNSSIYYTGYHQGTFNTGSSSNSCSCTTCSSNSSSTTSPHPSSVIISHVETSTVCPITLPFIITCTNCTGCPLSVQFNSSLQNVCIGGQVQFQDITNYSNWPASACTPQWSFPGGTVISNSPLVVRYTSAGSYSVSLTVTCTDGMSFTCPYTGSISNFITVTDCAQPGPTPVVNTSNNFPPCTYCPCSSCPPPTLQTHVTDYVHRDPPCDMCIHSFELTPGKKYLLSAWTKEKNPCTLPVCHAAISLVFPQTNSPALTFVPSGKVIDGWQRIEATFIVPNDAASIQIFLSNSSSNSSDDVYFDDIRIHPFDANMKSYVYDPVSLKLVSELDENNYATFYEYDEEGKLTRVKKETERGIATIKESRVNTKKN